MFKFSLRSSFDFEKQKPISYTGKWSRFNTHNLKLHKEEDA